jgi:hypothetical protein
MRLHCEQINKCNTTQKQNVGQKPHLHSIDAERDYSKMQHPFIIKAVKKVGI